MAIYQVRKSGGGWETVTKKQWIEEERACGFRPKDISGSDPDYWTTCATAGFSCTRGGSSVEGQILEEDD
ncbi:hypothetical protein EVB32_081 [Rhizobium phage RHph_TM39]|uniref:Uncharacterized protein n=1 Tax=Rhizobium phage RHph_TM30 TaxID=2509764 RepID=A0A7S5R4W9_9CAUD|nr:hypothetical protein PQC16_gp081 [Rhizobium phage RHph_TM30]QIG71552.1 hypothetical protein EVB94_081 [Rhizobium phage RHph_TM40]QIG71915.1 hypothetical protein EVB95_081 [Rhizobium phage RHph_TM2_3B]QIG72277.1 hypothetical protein EVB96_081 [Rhizobium phage RHph_TM3_3_6]QIG77069.1 hypothetical protein EVB32_081 [Rhizobium phage RHph_TM39]QIG77408.1 hypothetical protein EVB61_080 [Rhizobium phage RHph_TM21B]QIG77668.1 hypothetical protein EVB64_081 [Rhizobium phage RHph_TM61]